MPETLVLAEYLTKYTFSDENQLSLLPNNGSPTLTEDIELGGIKIKRYTNQFWTSRQRQAASLHEISYRACFKPQLPRFFINLLTAPGQVVYDPFTGRGTTIIEAAMLGRHLIANDINPLSRILCEPRLDVPELELVRKRLYDIPLDDRLANDLDLSMFYHGKTLSELLSLRRYLLQRQESGCSDDIDRWIRMVATNRLTGHSKGFFSVYTLPPNQAVTAERQAQLNHRRNQEPEYRDIKAIILKKSYQLLKDLTAAEISKLRLAAQSTIFLEKDASSTPEIKTNSVDLTVTSPPFLNIVQYSKDNWLRCWFNAIDVKEIEGRLTTPASLGQWTAAMDKTIKELYRVTRPGGWVAFEVGEIKNGKLNLEEHIAPLGLQSGFICEAVIINKQNFTKTSNIWGVNNNRSGTNSNRIVLFRKE